MVLLYNVGNDSFEKLKIEVRLIAILLGSIRTPKEKKKRKKENKKWAAVFNTGYTVSN